MLILGEQTLVSAGDMSGDITSQVFKREKLGDFAVQSVWTGSPVGILKLQVSIDNETFSDLAGASQVVSGAGNVLWNVENAAYKYARVFYDFTSGTGSLTSKACGGEE